MTHRITYYLDGRLFEWSFSVCCVALGMAMLVWPKMARGSIVTTLVEILTGPGVALLFFTVGLASTVALIINGNSYQMGPRVRSICAIIRSILWGHFTISMINVSINQGFPSPMIFFFSVFTASELYIVYRAVLDVRIE